MVEKKIESQTSSFIHLLLLTINLPDSNEFHVRLKKPGSQGASKFSVFF